mmetsp:Transcript_37581/g.55389  ORF Transcript_37581/g.55389 Transcript_37581/m.55389 type:complete len:97 (+) Transcript_37581:445-735(+)|eukprot:scaffold15599_cov129-Skeletonema_dohrnii-CCMP3373.AAC.13
MKDGASCNIEGEGTRWQHLSNRIVFCGIAFNGKQQRARAQMTRKKRKREGRTFSHMKTAHPIYYSFLKQVQVLELGSLHSLSSLVIYATFFCMLAN